MTTFETGVRVERPIDEVFAYLSDPRNLPHWNSAVRAVWRTSGQAGEVRSTYVMRRELPRGRFQNELEVFAREHPVEFGIRTTSGPTPFVYQYRLFSEDGETRVQLSAAFQLDGAAALLGPLAGRAVKGGVDDNLAALKLILETSARLA